VDLGLGLRGSTISSSHLFVTQTGSHLFRGGLVFKAHGLLYHSTLGLKVIKKKKLAPVKRFVLRVSRVQINLFFLLLYYSQA